MGPLEEMLLEIKDTSELMVDLAYSSLLYNNRDIAEEVYQMDGRMRELEDDIQEMAVQKATEDKDIKKALLIIRMAQSVGAISNAALKIADVVRRGVPPHPVIQLALRETDVIITAVTVGEGSDLAGATLGKVKLATNSGMFVIAIRRGRRYIYGPDRSTMIMAGDALYARGPEDGESYLRDLAGGREHFTPKDLE
ncbi:MAG: potassium channel protein [Methanomassiliicoccus sp.]|nr:potassium channel protein [Methanomassiliicoccus sp.]